MALTQTQVSQLYVSIFGRASEGNGNEAWQTATDMASAATAMLETSAAATYFGASLDSNQAFIEAIYLNTLGKTYAEDTAGVDAWVALLDGGTSRGEAVASLIDAIYLSANDGTDAQQMFINKVTFSNYVADNVAEADIADLSAFDVSSITDDSSTLADAIIDVVVDVGGGDGDGDGNGDDDGGAGTDDVVLLTSDQDNISTGGGNDSIFGYIFDNQNTAQSGDMIDGGTGNDSLYADIGNSQNFAITLHTNSVETFSVRAQAQAEGNDSNDNNMTNAVQITAERMDGTDRYESDNSRADVIIEKVIIEDTQITQDITIAMVQTDPGNVDFGVYFDIRSLTNAADVESGAVLDLNLMDVEGAWDPALDPLESNPYDQVMFSLDGVDYTLNLQNIFDVKTYSDLLAAVKLAVTSTVGLEDVTVVAGGTFDAIHTDSGTTQTGTSISLVNNGDGDFAPGGWNATGGVPADGEYYLQQIPGTGTVASSLITSTIVLDDVGRGSMGGDLIVGGLSTGDTSDSTGVEQFNITVERSSELQEINSTNNTLQEVYIVNGETNGNLVVAGDTNADNDLPGAQGDAGFTDVRILDASSMVGTVSIDAELTSNVTAKYMNLVDNGLLAADNTNFVYSLGTNNDMLNLDISSDNLNHAGATAREDFDLSINGNAGNDVINTIIGNGTGNDGTAWYDNSAINANLAIDAGTGDDTVTTTGAGNFTIDVGQGNDTVYTDNSGAKGSYAVNATAASTTAYATEAANDAAFSALLAAELASSTIVAAGSAAAAVTAAKAITALSLQTGAEIAAMDAALDAALVTSGATPTTIYHALIAASASSLSGNATLVSDPDTITNTTDAFLFGATLTVTYTGDVANSVIAGPAAVGTEGYESSVVLNTDGNYGNESTIVQAIKDAINNDAVLSKLLSATDGTGNTLIINNLIDGLTAAGDLEFSIVAANANGTSDGLASSSTNTLGATTILNAAELTSLKNDWNDFANTSGAPVTDAGMYFALNAAAIAALGAVTGPVVLEVGNESTATSDNVISMGAGDDVIVLGTNDASLESNDTLVWTGYNQGNDTIVNYLEGAANIDALDFSAYLTDDSLNKVSASGSVDSQTQIGQVLGSAAVTAADTIGANEIVIQTGLSFTAAEQTAGQSWESMTAADYAAAINNTSTTAYGNIANTIDADAGMVANFVGSIQTSIVLVENDLNDGEYKIFELSQDNTANLEFSDVKLIGTVDFGDSITTASVFI
ncbi:MAG: hypothetical protein L3I99_05625 [Sulfurimonas sp.]|nr:hypothetical protein [Sulfurimonas sp.]